MEHKQNYGIRHRQDFFPGAAIGNGSLGAMIYGGLRCISAA